MQKLLYENLNKLVDYKTTMTIKKDDLIVKTATLCFNCISALDKKDINIDEYNDMSLELLKNMKRYIIRQVTGVNYTDLLKMLYTSKELVNNQEVKEIINKMLNYIK